MAESIANKDVELLTGKNVDFRNEVNSSSAPSVWLRYYDKGAGDILTEEICVPSGGLTNFTYYCCLQWNTGQTGGGYCGIQDHPKGRNYIFSLWDPKGITEKITAVFVGPGSTVSRFGGEGTGLHCLNYLLGWESDCWYNLTTRRWNYQGHSYYGFWVQDLSKDIWTHIVTLNFPVANVFYNTPTGCFLEDWKGTGDNSRSAMFRDGHKRRIDQAWLPFDKARFAVAGGNNYDAQALPEFYYLKTGDSTIPSPGLKSGHIFQRNMAPFPNKPPISFSITGATSQEVTWFVPDSSTPQFRYTVTVDEFVIASDIDPEIRSCKINKPSIASVEVTLEDILGRKSSREATVTCSCCFL